MRDITSPEFDRYRYGDWENVFYIGELRAIVTTHNGWDHVSVSLPDRCPTWEEMSQIKRLFFQPKEWAVEYHPPVDDNVNVHPYCLHLWRPQQRELPKPDPKMVL